MKKLKNLLSRIFAAVQSTRAAQRIILLYAILVLIVVMLTVGEEISQTLAILQSVLVSLAAIGGVIVAAQGLDTWHKQISGRTNYDLAMKLGKNVIRLRNLLCTAGVLRQASQVSSDNNSVPSLIVSWQIPKYVDDLYDATEKLRANHAEAELLWGQEANRRITPLFQLSIELINYIGYLKSKESTTIPVEFKDSMDEEYEDKRSPIPRSNAQEDNAFQREVKSEAERVRRFLGRYLGPR